MITVCCGLQAEAVPVGKQRAAVEQSEQEHEGQGRAAVIRCCRP